MTIYKPLDGVPISKKILLTKEEASEMLSMSVSKINRLMKREAIPVKRIDGLVRFHRDELNAWAINLDNAKGESDGE
tara:strand:+ start:1132 stop:1362 length:231 start_codon:yes stop_codon:yes gene_type:complete